MKDKLRLILGRPVDAPFANSAAALTLLAVLLIGGSLLLWSDAGDTMFLSRESAATVEATVESCAAAGEDSYVPRLEIVADDGATYTLLQSQVGGVLETIAAELEPGDGISLTLSRKGRVLEVREGDLVHLDFDQSKQSARWDTFVSAAAAVVFDLLGLFLILRAILLNMNRKGAFRFGPAR